MLPPGKIISPTFSLIEASYLIYATCLAPAVVNGEISLGGDSPHLKLGVSDREGELMLWSFSSLSIDNRWSLKNHLQLCFIFIWLKLSTMSPNS